ncbi:MAG: helix-turn-helix transcriptional regulator [Clostridia bacterium]|nr:helix-turn-helix transcriptional regulator [Clostridia bacterium]
MFNFTYGGIDFAHKSDAASSPTESYYKHVHAFNEILYFVEGDVAYTVESETKTLVPGDLVLIAPGKFHFATVNSDVKYERYVLKFPTALLPKFLGERISTLNPFFGSVKEHSASFKRLDSYHNYGNFTQDELTAMFMSETIKLLIALSKAPAAQPHQINTVIAEVIQYIDENIRQPISLDSLCTAFHFSKSYLSNEFKRYMKVSIMQYVRTKKIIAAHQLILAGEKKSYVAEQFGFDNYSTFYRQYVRLLKEDALLIPPQESESE